MDPASGNTKYFATPTPGTANTTRSFDTLAGAFLPDMGGVYISEVSAVAEAKAAAALGLSFSTLPAIQSLWQAGTLRITRMICKAVSFPHLPWKRAVTLSFMQQSALKSRKAISLRLVFQRPAKR